jgi:hypothetical protein
MSALEDGFPFVAFFETDQVIAIFEVNFRKYFTITDAVLRLPHISEWVAVCKRQFVNSTVVNT